jgi:Zinc knuckle
LCTNANHRYPEMPTSLEKLTKDELCLQLGERNIPTTGTKAELLAKLQKVIEVEKAEEERDTTTPGQFLLILRQMQEQIVKLETSLTASQLRSSSGSHPVSSTDVTALPQVLMDSPCSSNSMGTRDIPLKDLLAWSVPTFSGLAYENPEQFLLTCEGVFREQNITSACWVAITTGHLRGEAQRWWQGRQYSRPTWEIFSTDLNIRFNDPSLLETFTAELHGERQKKGEPIESFIQKKVLLHGRVYPGRPVSAAIRTTVELLDCHVRPFLRAPFPLSVEELTTRAIQIDRDLKSTDRLKRPEQHLASATFNEPPALVAAPRSSLPSESMMQTSPVRREVECYNCRGLGHYSSDCPHPLTSRTQEIRAGRQGNEQRGGPL